MKIAVLPRIHERHPDVVPDDVMSAFTNQFIHVQRANGSWVGLGSDSHNRLLEMAYLQNDDYEIVIYHAMTPPTKKFVKEIERLTGRRVR